MSDLYLYTKWIENVQKLKNWPEPSLWTNLHFQVLSEEISEKSNILINRNTVRKFIDKVVSGEEYNPHSSTKDALALYIGYSNWQHFKNQQHEEPINKSDVQPTFKTDSKRNYWFYGFIAAAISIAIGLFIFFKPDNSEIFFQITNPIGTIPHTIECKYDLKDLKSNNIIIDYGHIGVNGTYTLETVNKQNVVSKKCFHYPGDFNIRLFVDNEVRAQQKIWINSLNWFVYANDAQPYITKIELPQFLKDAKVPALQNIPFESVLENETDGNGNFHIPEEKIKNIKNLSIDYHTHLKNFQAFGVDMRNCEFKIRFKDGEFGSNILCNESAIYLHGELGNIGFKFAEKGCEKYTHQRIGNTFYSSETEDLNHLIVGFNDFKTLKIKCSPTNIKLILDDTIIKTMEDNQVLGEVRGLDFWFKGSPYIDFVSLADGNGNIVYEDNFN